MMLTDDLMNSHLFGDDIKRTWKISLSYLEDLK